MRVRTARCKGLSGVFTFFPAGREFASPALTTLAPFLRLKDRIAEGAFDLFEVDPPDLLRFDHSSA